MISYIPYHSVDRVKYDDCLMRSDQFRGYAQSWFLDAVCEQWDLLVYDDYQAVMPLPLRKKWGLAYVFTPAWVQQLGIFSAGRLDERVIQNMVRRIPRSFFLLDYACNFSIGGDRRFAARSNYVLALDQDMNAITKGFKKGRKAAFNKDFGGYTLDTRGDRDALIGLYDKVSAVHQGHKDAREKLLHLLLANSPDLHSWLVYKNELPVAAMVWLRDHRRLTYLYAAVLPEFRKEDLATFLLKGLMEAYEASGLILDFEGSMHEGIASFFKSFGAVEERYYHYKRKFHGLLS